MFQRCGFIAAFILASFTAFEGSSDRRVALVTGNSAYREIPALRNPAKDAEAISDTFRLAGFEVSGAGNLTNVYAAAFDKENPQRMTSWGRTLFNGYGVERDMERLSCKSTPQTITGDQANLPTAASVSLDRSLNAEDISGMLAASYPWVVLDNATVHLQTLGATANFVRFCRLELLNGSKIVVGDGDLFLLSDYIVSSGGTITGLDSDGAEDAMAPIPASGVGASGPPGKSGASSSSVLIAVVVQVAGSLAIELNGAPGGQGGAGGNGGSLQVFRLQETIFPADAIAYSGRGGPGAPSGQGGLGGNGGSRGSHTTYIQGGNSDAKGPQGANGADGSSGIAGLDGTYRNSTVTEEDIANFF